ncbi:hypothetical protein TK1645 [Thermococcus kodakarensis KOD1]|uniref:Uncharacterized protein n=1 Tax=Thermococcus kodakarensis (strain ATCC BAA-918 / JCM 12380 / KOD1) TaxID=69014 RepID=Q5JIU1_THEKO|nr:hypothetical protein [Thermococcus kodakarensis]WCN27575.1 hypothetical protein POG15_08380 [Thermococcus kodakarensis]WCN29866.1 hypothetical protein POG21_08370 [Thermococcus kodakarensis]BAD85834.1 hypothetical protein TK1645 [Thermococcus kodakarensis KOD1]
MPTVTVKITVPADVDPEEIRRLVELEVVKLQLMRKNLERKTSEDFRKLRGILGKAEMEELKAYELEAEFGDLY